MSERKSESECEYPIKQIRGKYQQGCNCTCGEERESKVSRIRLAVALAETGDTNKGPPRFCGALLRLADRSTEAVGASLDAGFTLGVDGIDELDSRPKCDRK